MQQVLYTYHINKLEKSKRVRFVYLLKGRRDSTGLVEEFKGKFLVPGCFMIPIEHNKEMKQIFKTWGVKPDTKTIEIIG